MPAGYIYLAPMPHAPITATAPPTKERGDGASAHQQKPETNAKKPNSIANNLNPATLETTEANPKAKEQKNKSKTKWTRLNMFDPSI